MRRLALLVATVAMFFACSTAMAKTPVFIEYDGRTHEYTGNLYDLVVRDKPVYSDMSPIIFNDRALVPVREVCEAIGAQVTYSNATQTVEIIDGSTYIKLKINDNTAVVNGYKMAIPDNVVPKLISMSGGNAKTMVPVRFVSETIGLDVDFDAANGKILVDSSGRELATVTPTPVPTTTPKPTPVPTTKPTVKPTAKPTVKPTAKPTVKPTATPTPVATPTVKKSTMQKLNYSVKNSNITITIKLDKKTEYTYFTLSSPERLVVDFANTDIKLNQTNYEVNKGGINNIRVGVTDERTRIVVDTDKIVDYSFGKSGSTVFIYLEAKEDTQKPAATVNPTTSPTSKPTVTPTPTPTPVPTKKPIVHTATERYVVIDAGHGGSDPGALGLLDEETIRESDLTLSIAKKVKKYIEASGFKVYMTRTTDVYKTLIERPEYANDLDAAVFVSIHINSVEDTSSDAEGTEVYYAASNNDDSYGTTSEKLAKNVLRSMVSNMGSTNRGIKTAEHAVTKRSNMPSCLVEVGFISSEDELRLMVDEDYQNKTAKGIAEGILVTLSDIDIFD